MSKFYNSLGYTIDVEDEHGIHSHFDCNTHNEVKLLVKLCEKQELAYLVFNALHSKFPAVMLPSDFGWNFKDFKYWKR